MIVAPEHLDYLVTAAVTYGAVEHGKEQQLWSAMLMLNIDSELRSTDADSDHEMNMGVMTLYNRGYRQTEHFIQPVAVLKALVMYEDHAREGMAYGQETFLMQALRALSSAAGDRAPEELYTEGEAYKSLPAHITAETKVGDTWGVGWGRDAVRRIR